MKVITVILIVVACLLAAVPSSALSSRACNNGRDDDADTLIDYPEDPGCHSKGDNSEENVVTPPPTDSDQDGVPDSVDLCPDTPLGTTVDTSGCPIGGGGGNEPAPIAGMGYHEVFHDDFDAFDRSVWDDHIWYDEPPSSSWTGFQTVENGVLHLRSSSSFTGTFGNWPINTVTTLSSGITFTTGYFEAQVKYTYAGDAAWPAFWLTSYRHAIDPVWPLINPICAEMGLSDALCVGAELDVLDNGGYPNEWYFGVHRDSAGYAGWPDDQRPDPAWETFPDGTRLGDNWHTYAMLWTPTTLIWYFDDRPVASAATFDTTNQPQFLLLQNWIGDANRWGPAISGSNSDVQVDRVAVWQR